MDEKKAKKKAKNSGREHHGDLFLLRWEVSPCDMDVHPYAPKRGLRAVGEDKSYTLKSMSTRMPFRLGYISTFLLQLGWGSRFHNGYKSRWYSTVPG